MFAQTSEFSKQLDFFDKTFSTSTQTKQIELHNSLKHIYIESIMKDDHRLKYEVLTRLASSSKALDYDYSGYEKEAKTLEKIYGNLKKSQNEKSTQIKISTATRLIGFEHEESSFIFSFDKEVKKEDIKHFVMSDKGIYRYIYDINTIATVFKNDKNIKGLEQLRVSQFDKSITRVVFSNDKRLTTSLEIQKNRVIITIQELQVASNTTKTLQTNNATTIEQPRQNSSANNKIVVIDAGHGGKDSGAMGTKKLLEKNIVLNISLLLGAELEKRGYKIFYTRKNDIYIKLGDRTKVANNQNADIFISIHANAAPLKSQNGKLQGIETYFLSPARSKRSINVAALENQSDMEEMDFYSKQTFLNFLNREKIIASHKLAIDIQQYVLGSVRKEFKAVDGGVREAPFWVLVGAQMPSILFEVGYITNSAERDKIFNKQYQKLLTNGIADGIDAYFEKTNTFYE